MSYEIIYDRTFIKTTRGIIPMILHGSSNVTEMIRGREVLQRYWSCYNDALIEFPEREMHQALQDLFGDTLKDPKCELFKWRSNWLYGNQLENWFQSGIRNAATLEEISQANYGAGISIRVFQVQPETFDTILHSFPYLQTTEKLEQSLDEAKAMIQSEEKEGREAYLHLSFFGREPMKKTRRSKIEEPCLIKCRHGYFGEENGRYGVTFYADPQKAHVFADENEAIRSMSKWFHQRRMPYRVVKASTVLKEKPYVLYVESGFYAGLFVQKRTSTRIYFAKDVDRAWRFDSIKRANQAAEKITQSFSEKTVSKISVVERN